MTQQLSYDYHQLSYHNDSGIIINDDKDNWDTSFLFWTAHHCHPSGGLAQTNGNQWGSEDHPKPHLRCKLRQTNMHGLGEIALEPMPIVNHCESTVNPGPVPFNASFPTAFKQMACLTKDNILCSSSIPRKRIIAHFTVIDDDSSKPNTCRATTCSCSHASKTSPSIITWAIISVQAHTYCE